MNIRYAILFVAFLAMPVIAEDLDANSADFDIFQLGQPCVGPVGFLLAVISEDAKEIGLTQEAVDAAVRSRLRGARIYDQTTFFPLLVVSINVAGQAFVISVELAQKVYREVALGNDVRNISGPAVTWSTVVLGTHGHDPGFILQSLNGQIDKFIDEYLRVNEKACELSE